jgi:predicted permease
MSWRRLASKVAALVRRRRLASDLREEMRVHIQMEAQENIESGMAPDEARRAALRRFGNTTLAYEESRNMWVWHSMETLWQDIRFGCRQFSRHPGFTAAAILTLALGIGANAAIFSVGNVFIFRPLPVKDADRLVVVAVQYRADADPGPLSYPDYADYRAQADVFTDMTFYELALGGLGHRGEADRIILSYVPSNFFSMLGVHAAIGRVIAPGEGDAPTSGPVVVLGHGYWVRRFAADPNVIGTSVTLDGQPVTVIGVVPEEFRGPYNLVEMDAYLPIGMYALTTGDANFFTDRRDTELRVLATLKPRVTAKQAETALNVIARRLASAYPDADQGQIARVIPEHLARPEPSVADSMTLIAAIFLVMVGLVLLVACFNVANLLLARAADRHREIAVRAAMGASRGRLLRQMLTESFLLALAGAVGGALIGTWATRAIETLRPLGDFTLRLAFAFDWRVFTYVAGVALAAGIVAGLVPALRISGHTDLNDAMREAGRGAIGDPKHHWLRNGLVVLQVAGSLILLVEAGLFTRSLANAQAIDLGFDPHNVLNVGLDPKLQGYDQTQAETFFRDLLRRAQSLPGVDSAALAFSVPLGYYSDGTSLGVEGRPTTGDARGPEAGYNCVTADYFSTMRMRMVRGRAFTDADVGTSTPVAIVNETMAARLWPGVDALGRRFSYRGAQGPFPSSGRGDSMVMATIVGIVRDARVQGLLKPPGNFFYVPQSQNYKSPHVLHLRTGVPPRTLIGPIENLVKAIDPRLPVFDVMTMDQAMGGANGYFLFTVAAAAVGTLGGLGLLLAVVGVYGVVAYAVSQRRHEIGVRVALGAHPGSVLRLVVNHAAMLVGTGVIIGVIAALGVSRMVVSFLVGVPSYDPLTFLAVSAVMVAVALVASYIPARRATKIDPVVALRHE